MIQSKRGILLALTFPLLALALLTIYKDRILSTGQEVILPITGYDPRDPLSGHYLTYRIRYGVPGVCSGGIPKKGTGYICLDPIKVFTSYKPINCHLFIKGKCRRGHFKAGIERFYVPEELAQKLEHLVESKKASIVLSVSRRGKALVKDLLIDGISWRN